MKKRTLTKIMSYLLITAMLVGGLTLSPLATVKVRADGPTVKNINLRVGNSIAGIGNPTSGIDDDATGWTGSTVYYGNRAYYVLDKDGYLPDKTGTPGTHGHSSLPKNMLLLSKDVYTESTTFFDFDASNWSDSTIRSYLNHNNENTGFYDTSFTAVEQEAISETTINNDNTDDGGYSSYPDDTTNDHVFLLDLNDVQNKYYGFSSDGDINDPRKAISGSRWWLRSPGEYADSAAFVGYSGDVASSGYVRIRYGIRPAFNFDPSSVLFSSAIGASKSSFAVVDDSDVSNNAWKLTLQDTDTDFNATLPTTAAKGKPTIVSVNTAGSGTVSYNQISAMLVDDTNTVIAYGKIGEAKTGSMTFAIPVSIAAGTYTLKVFPEQVNEGTLTDIAGQVVESILEVEDSSVSVASVTVDPLSVSLGKGTSQTFTATVNGNDNPVQTVIWSVTGNSSANTSISATDASSAVLTVGKDELATTLTVTATSTVDKSKSGTATVAIIPTKNINLKAHSGIIGIYNPTSVSDANATGWEGTTVYYGNKPYYVLDKDGNLPDAYGTRAHGHSSVSGNMLLLSKGVLAATGRRYNRAQMFWSRSEIRTYLNSTIDKTGFYDTAFTETEQLAISETALNGDNTYDYYDYNSEGHEYYYENTDDKIFLLDLDDVGNTNYGFCSNATRIAEPNCSSWWWLRSPGCDTDYAVVANVTNDGVVDSYGDYVFSEHGSARPAFNLNLSSVLFSSASEASKSSFAAVDDSEVSNNAWKLTLQDTDIDFDATLPTTATKGKLVTVSVNTAGSGTVSYNQTSAMLVDDTNTVITYGKIGEATTGSMTFRIPLNTAAGTYTLKVFPEQVNGGTLTDYAGKVVEGNLEVEDSLVTVTSVTVTPSTVNVPNGTSQTFTATVSGNDNPEQTVTWSVTGNRSADTSISANGVSSNAVLTVGRGETAATLTVTATSDVDTSISGTATVVIPVQKAKNINLKVDTGIIGVDNPTSGIDINATGWEGTTVYYGNKPYYVLDRNGYLPDTTGNPGTHGHSSLSENMLLLSQDVIADLSRIFDDSGSNWSHSDIREYLNPTIDKTGFYDTSFTAGEQEAISETTINHDNTDDGGHSSYPDATTNDHVFLLDLNDVQNKYYGFSSNGTRTATSVSSHWWLRSSGNISSNAAYVSYDGGVGTVGCDVNRADGSVRPAFNLNLSSVLFSSASEARKSSFAVVDDSKVSSNAWKLTLQDTNTEFDAALPTTVIKGKAMTVSVNMVGSGTVSYNQISAMLVDDDNTVIAYGKIGEAETGSMTFTVPGSIEAGTYTLKVFPEQVNEGTLTDYAGQVVEGNLEVKDSSVTVMVDPSTVNLEWGTSQTFKATVSGNNNPAQTVTWSLTGNRSASTRLSATGVLSTAVLTVGNDETATTLTVTATSTIDTSKSGTATVVLPIPTARDINPIVNNNIAGIANPTSGTVNNATAWAGTTVYYGGKAYYVLDKDGSFNGHSSVVGNMLLLSKDIVGTSVFDYYGEMPGKYLPKKFGFGDWSSSTIRDNLNGSWFYSKSGVFTAAEQGAIIQTKINNDNTDDGGYSSHPSSTTNDHIFLLDLNDAQNTYYGFSSNETRRYTTSAGTRDTWWLRSAGCDLLYATRVNLDGSLAVDGSTSDAIFDQGVRPAFNLNLSSVLFSSAIAASKSDFAVVGDSKGSSNAWKLTIRDTDTNFEAKLPTTANKGKPVTVLVEVAGSGTESYNQTSAMLLDDTNTVIAYGKIGEAKTGCMTFTIPMSIAAGTYKLKVFPEQVNGGTLTDYAGKVVEGSLEVKDSSVSVTSVTVDPPAVSMTQGTSQTFTATVSGKDDPLQTVTWSVSGNSSAYTRIVADSVLSNAVLTVGRDETADTLTVTATSTIDTSKSGVAIVTVITLITSTAKNINLNVDNTIAGIGSPTSTTYVSDDDPACWTGSQIYMGHDWRDSPRLWMVLDSTGMLLLQNDPYMDRDAYHDTSRQAVTWEGSTIRSYLNGYDGSKNIANEDYKTVRSNFIDETFSSTEKTAILETTLDNSQTAGGDVGNNTIDKLFLLSLGSGGANQYGIENSSYGFANDKCRALKQETYDAWWLRSPNLNNEEAASVLYDGRIQREGNFVNTNHIVRAAFNLNLSSVLLSSASGANKSDFATVGDDMVSANTWKLTFKDTDNSFDATLPISGALGAPIKVNVKKEGSGSVSYNQTSAMLVDENNTVTAYGKIGDASKGDKTFTIPSTIPTGNYTLMVFPEQVNGDNLTDYAGQVVSQPIAIVDGASAMVILQKDGAPNTDTHTVSLFKGGEEQHQLTEKFDGVYSDIGFKGEYDIYVDGSDTGYDIATEEKEEGVVINYYTVSLTAGDGIKSVSGSGIYLEGTNVPIHAEMEDGYSFGEWKQTADNEKVSTENEYLIRNIESPHDYTACGKETDSPVQDVEMTIYSGKYEELSEVTLSENNLTGTDSNGSDMTKEALLTALKDYEWEYKTIDLSDYADCSKTFYLSKKSNEGAPQENKSYPDIPVTVHFTSLTEVKSDIKEGETVPKGSTLPLKVTTVFTQGVLADTITISANETAKTKLGLTFSQPIMQSPTENNIKEYTMNIDTTNAKPGTTKVTIKATITEGVSPMTITRTVSTTANLTVTDEAVSLTYDQYYAAEAKWDTAQKEASGKLRDLNPGDGAEINNVKVNGTEATTIKLVSTDETVLEPIKPTTETNAASVRMEAKKAGTVLITIVATTDDQKTAKDTFRVTVTEGMKTTITTDKDVINKAKKAQYEEIVCTVKTNNASVNAANISINEVKKLSGDKKSYIGDDIPFAIQQTSGNTFSLVIKNDAKDLDKLNGKYRIKYTYKGAQATAGETLEPFEITVTKEMPSVTIKQTKKVNLFHVGVYEKKIKKVGIESKGSIQVSPKKNAVSYNAVFEGEDFMIPTITDQTGNDSAEAQGMGVSSTDVSIKGNVVTRGKKVTDLNQKVNYTITFPEYRGEGNKSYEQTGNLTIATATTKPKLSAVIKNPVLYSRFDIDQTELSILLDDAEVPNTSLFVNEMQGNLSIPDGQYQLTANKPNIDLSITQVDMEKVLWIKNTDKKTTTVTLTLQKSTWTSPLTTKVKLIVDNNLPTAKLTKDTLNLNNRYASYEQASTDIRLQNAEGFKVIRMKITPMDQKTVAVSNKLNVMYQSGTQTIKTEFKNGVTNGEVKKGTYNYVLIPYYAVKVNRVWKTSVGQALKLKTVVSDKDMILTVTGKGTIDLPIRETTGITYTPKVQNITGTITKVELTGVNRDLFELTNVNQAVTGKTNPAGTVRVQAKAGSSLRTGTKYPIYLKYTLQTANGRITKSSKALTITPKQTAAKVNWTSAGKTTYTTRLKDWTVAADQKTASNEKQLTFTIQKPAGATIDKIVAQDPSGLFEFAYSSDGENPDVAIKGETVGYIRVTAKDITKVNLKKTYKVKCKIYLEDSAVNAKPLTTTVKIKIKK